MRFVLVFLLFCLSYFAIGQSIINLEPIDSNLEESSREEFLFVPNLAQIKSDLQSAPRSKEINQKWIKMSIPFSDGKYYDVEAAEAPVVAKVIYDRYPENRSYKIRGIKDKYISGRMSITPKGLTALLYTRSGNLFIEPVEGKIHKAYDFDGSILESFSCETDHSKFKKKKNTTSRASFGSDERKFIIAIASSGEFSAKHGNNLANVNAIINDYLTLLNTLYERDLAITFELTADNDDIIFFDPDTDGIETSYKLSSAQTVINNGIGSGNYDIGHVFYEIAPPSNGSWTGSGIASLGVVCSSNSKARGWTGCGGPYDNSFWMGIFAHEVGHQFEATHTFYGTSANCQGSQRSIGNGVEPGSGNSLMSYEGSCFAYGSCNNQNITPESSFQYFHSHSIDQVQSFVSGTSCHTTTSTGNSPPEITMPASKTIPTETPFYLSATVTDPDGDPLLSSWEEVDTDNLNLSCPNGAPNDAATSQTAPLFRSFDPSAGGNLRYFPQLSDILDDTQTMGEILPEVGRTIDMRCIARGTDANGISGVSYEDVTLTVDGNSGPFEVTTASTPIAYTAGQSVNVVWTVNNTDQAPISCSQVNILFSNDGGNTFPITLAANTLNDGSQTVTMPGNATSEGRIKVEAVGNIFFSISKGDITIISSCMTNSTVIINDDDVTADAGDPALNLDLIIGGTEVTSVSAALESSDPFSNLTVEEASSGNCIAFNQFPYYDTFKFIASASDNYTFNVSGTFLEIINIYGDEFIPASSCANWLASSATYNPPSVSIGGSTSVTLIEGDIVEMKVSGFYPGVTGTYTVNLSSSGTGTLLSTDIVPVGYDYKYVIYNSAGFIVGIEDTPDLTDDSKYTNDIFTVKGLLVLSTESLNSYINVLFSTLQSDLLTGTVCGELSTNDVIVTIIGCNAGTKMVTSTLDNGGIGTLRYKVENACPGDVIQFDPALLNSTIVLGSEIVIDQNMTITGLGMNNISISGNNTSRIFSILPGVTTSIGELSLINGYALIDGGALLNNGILTLENIKFQGNSNGLILKAFSNVGTVNLSNNIQILD